MNQQNLPDWMPPITINNDSKYYPDQVARMMREYAISAVESYKKSLVPVAWMKERGKKTNPANPAVVCDGAKQLLYVVGNARAEDYSIQLYRLDDQP